MENQKQTQTQQNKQIIIQALKEKGLNVCSCGNTLNKEITFNKKFFSYYKVISFVCSCGFLSTTEIKISKDDYEGEINNKRIIAENTTRKTYEQEYKQYK